MMSKKGAEQPIAEVGLPPSVANVFAARNIRTAKDVLLSTEFDLMELSGLGLDQIRSAVLRISEELSPPCQTGLSLWEKRLQQEQWHLPTRLKGLDFALCGGIPFGVITEVVGPAGIGKTQFCLKLALLAALPLSHGGLDGQVIYVDVEFKFNTKRLIEIGTKSFPDIFNGKEMEQEITRRILILRPSCLSEFTESLERINTLMLQHRVKLLVIDSMTALVSGENEQGTARKSPLSWHISFLKSAAEASRVPILVTNQVRSQSPNEVVQYNFEAGMRQEHLWGSPDFNSCLVAALGVQWSHAVTIRLIFEVISGQRFMKVAKSPMSPPVAFPFRVISSGISLLDDCGRELVGKQIHTISCQEPDKKRKEECLGPPDLSSFLNFLSSNMFGWELHHL
ncbi:hypothetical protein MLD38_027592 [Melastoma candidum]|uniref:Uncharacterized protein n=1 Tax=Melastoma candidum TaxID=119954 RepID=A0ACB9P5F4_9MYRT|nr:hypothetical protein MLD38_027592 [Melastoma candidum]